MSGNVQTSAPTFTKNTSANLSLENPILINLNQFSYDLANQLQQKNSNQHPASINEDEREIDNIEKMLQSLLKKLREPESPLTAQELLLAIATCIKKQIIEQQSTTETLHLDLISSSDNTKTFSTISARFWPEIPKLDKLFQFIETNYNQQINLSNLATEIGYSEAYVCTLVKNKTGRTIHNWIVERRMIQARHELLTTDKTVTKIAATVGYEDTGNFINQFRKLHNKTPKVWRNMRDTQELFSPIK